jgi:putative oxidoreductase
MNTLERISHWGDVHHPVWVDFVRVTLGLVLIIKGLSFVTNPAGGLESAPSVFLSLGAMHYIIFAHVVGGLMISFGIATRIAVLFQIPILVWPLFASGAAFGIAYGAIMLPLILLIMSILILIYGSGPWSVDAYWRKHPNS